ncbi:transcription antitermination factor NusB [bacterium]|nr:transcription antitermination factor NusB [bacterium]
MKLLFQMDVGGQSVEEVLRLAKINIKASEEVWNLAREKLLGIVKNLPQIDENLREFTREWGDIDRLTYIDRNILRIATYELLYEDETPTGVIIAEAVKLAESYGTENSARFVNGVLSNMARKLRSDGEDT